MDNERAIRRVMAERSIDPMVADASGVWIIKLALGCCSVEFCQMIDKSLMTNGHASLKVAIDSKDLNMLALLGEKFGLPRFADITMLKYALERADADPAVVCWLMNGSDQFIPFVYSRNCQELEKATGKHPIELATNGTVRDMLRALEQFRTGKALV